MVGGQRRSAARYAGTHAHTHAHDKTDAADAGGECERRGRCGRGLGGRMQQQQQQVLSLLALLEQKWYKSINTDAEALQLGDVTGSHVTLPELDLTTVQVACLRFVVL